MTGCRPLVRALAVLAVFGASRAAVAAELVVSAAASLTNAFTQIGADFEASRPGNKVAFNFAASDVLLTQIARGAPADVYASADEAAMNAAVERGLVDPATRFDFARNRLVLIVPAGESTPASLARLADPAYKRIALGSPATVPVGRYAKAALERAGLWAALEPRIIPTQNVRQSLDYVARGECDAGFVYATDAATLPDKVRVAFEVVTPSPVLYPVAVVRATTQRGPATAFVEYLRSANAARILARHGFGAP
jgi:molybdate transport system substrate-binding protein